MHHHCGVAAVERSEGSFVNTAFGDGLISPDVAFAGTLFNLNVVSVNHCEVHEHSRVAAVDALQGLFINTVLVVFDAVPSISATRGYLDFGMLQGVDGQHHTAFRIAAPIF